MTYLQLYGAAAAIVSNSLRDSSEQQPAALFHELVTMDHIASIAYAKLSFNHSVLKNKVWAWENELGMSIDYDDFLSTVKNVYVTTNITKYRSFQYRLLMRALVTNIHISKWNSAQSSLCTLCKQEKKTYVHLFVYCRKVREMWLNLEKWFKSFSNENIEFRTDTVIANKLVDKKNHLFNFLCLLMKQFIYKK